MRVFAILLVLFVAGSSVSAQWIKQNVDTTASFRGLSVVNEKVVWASGTSGTVIKTIDGGKTWKVMTVPGAEKLDFRDIEAFDANTAYILSIGNGASSRIYKTVDGGKTWNLQFKNDNEKAFFDAIACWDNNNCIAVSDPVDAKWLLIDTHDGGKSWRPVDTSRMPAAKTGEAAFAASGTCLISGLGPNRLWLVTGGGEARVFTQYLTVDSGYAWRAKNPPIGKGSPGRGIFSIAMRDAFLGIIVGGDYEKPDEAANNFATTTDGGKSWTAGTGLSGYRSGVTFVDRNTIVAVGTNGSDISTDRGKTWKRLGDENLNAVGGHDSFDYKTKRGTWAVGPKGLVVKLNAT